MGFTLRSMVVYFQRIDPLVSKYEDSISRYLFELVRSLDGVFHLILDSELSNFSENFPSAF